MSPGTIDSLLANSHADFKFGTISPLLQVLVGGKWQGDPCTDLNSTAGAEIKEKIRQLEADIRHKEETIRHYEDQISSMKTLITNTNARHASSQDFLREQLRGRNKAVAVLSFFLGVCLLAIIGALVIDKLNPNIGFFWLDEFASWLNTSSVIRGNA